MMTALALRLTRLLRSFKRALVIPLVVTPSRSVNFQRGDMPLQPGLPVPGGTKRVRTVALVDRSTSLNVMPWAIGSMAGDSTDKTS